MNPLESNPGPTYAGRMKSKGGFDRVTRAFGYTWEGLKAAYHYEHAFRQEVWALAPFAIAAWVLPHLAIWVRALLFGSLLLVLIVELINSAIEANTDHISLDRHPLAKRAKDMGSAAVFLAFVNAGLIWTCSLISAYGSKLWSWLI